MKTSPLLFILALSIANAGLGQTPAPDPAKLSNAAPCVTRQAQKRSKRPVAPVSAPASSEPAAEYFVGEAVVEVTKDQTVVRLAMAQHASVLIELPANDGPRYLIPGDPEMVTVDEKALERNKRAIIVRPGSLFVPPLPNQKKRAPAATVTAQMRSGLVVTFLFYPVADLAQNVHRCVLSYQRDQVVARRRAAGLPVNLDQKEDEKRNGPSGASVSMAVDPAAEARATDSNPISMISGTPETENTSKPPDVRPSSPPVLKASVPPRAAGKPNTNDHAVAAAKKQLARAIAEPALFKNWTRPLHGLALSAVQDGSPSEDFRVLLLAIKNSAAQSLKLVPGTPDLILEMFDDRGKVINVQSVKPLHVEVSNQNSDVVAGGTSYYAIAYKPPLMGVQQRLKIVVAQTNAIDEPASIALLK